MHTSTIAVANSIIARKEALVLSAMSHAKETPWLQTKMQNQRVINKELIKEHFRTIGQVD